MFNCNHNGRCCEDPTTQISLTLGDLKRISMKHKKTVVQLYQEGIIGIFPFGNPFKDNEYETDVGLFVPCKHRIYDERIGKTICSVYEKRPLNCRLFPIWILADAPLSEIIDFSEKHPCGKCCGIDDDFEEDRKIYRAYKNDLVKILETEVHLSDPFYEKIGLKQKIITKKSKTQKDDLVIVKKLVKKLQKQNFTDVFTKIEQEIAKHNFVVNLPSMGDYL
ncbi:MAG: YkgJ family cysteine cluster protein [Candidatus Woesearchaeota archaeon]